jgi:dCMP deaminase
MGDISEWILEQLDDALGDYSGEFDDAWPEEFYPKKKIPTCRYCGKFPLRWRQVCGRWVLHERDGKYHDCPQHPLPLNVLKDILAEQKKKHMSEWDDFRDTIGQHGPMVYNAATGKAEMQQLLPMPSWDEQFMHDVYWWARRSKDPRTKIGALLVDWDSKVPFAHSYNSFARKVEDLDPKRWERPEKYEWVVHAEENTVLNCGRRGYCSKGAVMYTQGVPCTRCADACIQGGIVEVVVHRQWQEYEKKFAWDKWIDSAKRTEQKFNEVGIKVRVFDGVLGMQGVLDGKVINI